MSEDYEPDERSFLDGVEDVVPSLYSTPPRTGNCDKVPLLLLSDFASANRAHEKQGEDIEEDLSSCFQGEYATSIRGIGLHLVHAH